ncbi:MAG: hypothetical protein AAGA69_09765, partial [Pseudomonadota bacterium]
FPRARFAQWRFALVNASFQGRHIEEIRFQLTIHDLIPFIAVADGAWQSDGNAPLRFGDDVRLFAHRASSYEDKLRAMSEHDRRLLVALAHDLPLLLARSEREIPSRHLADLLASELRLGVMVGEAMICGNGVFAEAAKLTANQ